MRILKFTIALLMFSGVANAQSLAEKKEMKSSEETLTTELKDLNDACGSKMTASIDWTSFKGSKGEEGSGYNSAGNYCGGVLEGIADTCSDADAKPTVVEKVKSIKCTFDKTATKDKLKRYGPAMEIKSGALSARFNWETGNMGEETKNWLMNNL